MRKKILSAYDIMDSMVESYSKNANHNMRRPVVKEEIVDFMRTRQAQNTGFLKELEEFAHQENIPVIPHETVAYFRLLMQTLQPKRILEVGTAIGFSALLMADNSPHSKITTIDRNEEMIGFAKENFAKYDYRQQIELLEGEAMDILPTLPDNTYDFIFMDSAKSKYIVFLPEVLKKVKVGGLIILDDISQGGDVPKDIKDIRRGQRTIYREWQLYSNPIWNNPNLTAILVPIIDGPLF
ncbi:Predicted O-methyltransferase [Streptococcus suis 98HAH33]|nr:Predicted O-methyltransferase [Streptococcus suis 98HAH33]